MLPVIARICPTQKEFGEGNLTVANLELIVSNETFFTQTCVVEKTVDLNTNIVTVNGGEIALDHPIGASECRILVTLIY